MSRALSIVGVTMSMLRRYHPRTVLQRRAERRRQALLADAEDGGWRSMRAVAAERDAADDRTGAEGWLLRGIDAGDPDAIYQMGQLFDRYDGLEAAEPWFRRAAEAGHPIARRLFRPGGVYHPPDSPDGPPQPTGSR
jgi:hypothetical protein